jgi:tripartite-type tricarboxylate transporter receptor subunit TctC
MRGNMSHKLIAAVTAAVLSISGPAIADYPEREVLGVVMWGAGDATDTVASAVNPAAEEELGTPVVVSNKSGGAGAISTAFFSAAASDGYTLLYGAENPQLHGVMGVSQLDYSDYYPVNILGSSLAVVVVPVNSDYQTMVELLADVAANPSIVKMGSTGPGGLPSTISALISSSTDFKVTAIPFD